jgi:uncharacterized protein involved in high-affinity Fe2+ transport
MRTLVNGAATLMAAGLALGINAAAIAADAANGNGNGSSLLPFEASYNFNYKGLNAATTTLVLTRGDGDRWIYRSSGEARGIFRALPIDNPNQSSEMRVTRGGVQPLNFSQRNGAGEDRAIDIHFNWDSNRVQGMVEKNAVDETVPPDTQDDLSIQIALITAMARGEDTGTFHTYGDRGLREYRYRADGEELLHTAVGEIPTRIFVTERSGSPRTTRYWCAPSFGYLPLRVQQKRQNDVEWTLEVRTLKRG